MYLDEFANEGLRTLLVGEREISQQEYDKWSTKYNQALLSMTDREKQIEKVAEIIEVDFELVGSTAIEDKLQDEVGKTIMDVKKAGVKVWVLTGDKIETAINIGFSCELLDKEMEIFVIDKESTKDIYKQIRDFNK